jgi:isoaspartyl peptidase/L-asparaginase-like protein (Ntn-hydrolase superfamily)
VSCTGPGEAIIRLSLARLALTGLSAGIAPHAACMRALDELAERLAARAGLIVVTPAGIVASRHTTDAMPVAWRTDADAGIVDQPEPET